jgi:hypothetical protein
MNGDICAIKLPPAFFPFPLLDYPHRQSIHPSAAEGMRSTDRFWSNCRDGKNITLVKFFFFGSLSILCSLHKGIWHILPSLQFGIIPLTFPPFYSKKRNYVNEFIQLMNGLDKNVSQEEMKK